MFGREDIVVHRLKEFIETLELSFKTDQSFHCNFDVHIVKLLFPEIVDNVYFHSSFLLEILVMRVCAQAACSSIGIATNELEIDEIHAVGEIDQLLFSLPLYFQIGSRHT